MSFQMENFRRTYASVNLDHIGHNFHQLRQRVPGNLFFCPVVKSNAYGHGAIEVALFLQKLGCQDLAVGMIEEAIEIRQMGYKGSILVFAPYYSDGMAEYFRWNLIPVISNWNQVEALRKVNKPLGVHLKFDTGMRRLGFQLDEAPRLFSFFEDSPQIRLQALMTHLHSSENAGDPTASSFDQLREFELVEKVFKSFRPFSHALNSGGLLHFDQHRKSGLNQKAGVSLYQGCRPGLSIFGYSSLSSSDLQACGVELKPAISVRSFFVQIQHLKPHQSLSYGGTWRAQGAATIGVLPIGYADGIHRAISNRGEVLVSGMRAPVVGNVTMDYLMVDLSALPKKSDADWLAQEVTVLGFDAGGQVLGANVLASAAMTIPWEVLTSLSERIPRRYNSISTGVQREQSLD